MDYNTLIDQSGYMNNLPPVLDGREVLWNDSTAQTFSQLAFHNVASRFMDGAVCHIPEGAGKRTGRKIRVKRFFADVSAMIMPQNTSNVTPLGGREYAEVFLIRDKQPNRDGTAPTVDDFLTGWNVMVPMLQDPVGVRYDILYHDLKYFSDPVAYWTASPNTSGAPGHDNVNTRAVGFRFAIDVDDVMEYPTSSDSPHASYGANVCYFVVTVISGSPPTQPVGAEDTVYHTKVGHYRMFYTDL